MGRGRTCFSRREEITSLLSGGQVESLGTLHHRSCFPHYSRTWLKRHQAIGMGVLSSLERSHVGLKCCRHLLQTVDRQLIGDAQCLLAVALVDDAMGSPRTRAVIMAIGGEAPLLPHEAERGDARQPIKPLSRIRYQRQLAFLGTDDHIGSLCAVFDQSRHARPSPLFYRKRLMPPMRDASRLLPC